MKTLTTAILLLLAGATQAQTIWRCGADGRSYSDSPCTEGRAITVSDTRSSADLAAARGVAARERALARELAQQRTVSEAQQPLMAGIRHTPVAPAAVKTAKKPRSAPKTQSPAALGTWQAVAPASR